MVLRQLKYLKNLTKKLFHLLKTELLDSKYVMKDLIKGFGDPLRLFATSVYNFALKNIVINTPLGPDEMESELRETSNELMRLI